MTLRLTKVSDLMAGWSWEATPYVDGYKYLVRDPQGNPWGRDVYVGYTGGNDAMGIGGYYCNLAESHPKQPFPGDFDEYVSKHLFEHQDTSPRKVRKHGEWLVKTCIKNYLKYKVHPNERPTIGVKYVGQQ